MYGDWKKNKIKEEIVNENRNKERKNKEEKDIHGYMCPKSVFNVCRFM